ncbi:MAG: hypothetical protein K8I30_15405, partial [Anaerolineae bacterium]|nr:hypothetical protein [Anaerolineae bacterium]
FWVWSLALIYVGARWALGGRWWSSLLVVIAWMVVVVVMPVISGEIQAPESETALTDSEFTESLPDLSGLPFSDETEEGSLGIDFGEEAPLDESSAIESDDFPLGEVTIDDSAQPDESSDGAEEAAPVEQSVPPVRKG